MAPELSGKRINPSRQQLIAEIMDCEQRIQVIEKRVASAPGSENRQIIDVCKQKMEEAKEGVYQGNPLRRKIILAWRLVHKVHAELILFMNPQELTAQGRQLVYDLKMSSLPNKTDWIIRVEEQLKELEKDTDGKANITQKVAQLFKTVSNVLSNQVDDRFWDIWTRKTLAWVYTGGLLTMGFIGFFSFKDTLTGALTCPCQFPLPLTLILLLGAIGGLASGIITGEQEYIAKGHFAIPLMYYSLVRPALGALAAVLVFWMLQGEYLIKIEPQLKTCQCSCVTPTPLSLDCDNKTKDCPSSCLNSTQPSTDGSKKPQTEVPPPVRSGSGYIPPAQDPLNRIVGSRLAKDDIMGPQTDTAIRPVQERHKPKVEGIAEQQTKDTPKDALKKGSATPTQLPKKDATPQPLAGDSGQGKTDKDTLVTLHAAKDKQIYLYLLVLVLAGFSGDKLLKSVSDKLMGKLVAQAEKTKEAPPSS